MSHLAQTMSGSRSNEDGIRNFRQVQMRHLIAGDKQPCRDRIPAYHLEGQRTDKSFSGARHDDVHLGTLGFQTPAQGDRLIGGDAARHAEHKRLAGITSNMSRRRMNVSLLHPVPPASNRLPSR